MDKRIRKLFKQFYDLFDGDLPKQWNALRIKPLKIPLKHKLPNYLRPRYVPKIDQKQTEALEQFMTDALSRSIIRRSTSNFLSNVLLVKRPEIIPGVARPMRVTMNPL